MKKSKFSIFRLLNTFLLTLLCLIMIYPFLNQLAISLNEGRDTMHGGITIFPRAFTLDNYRAVLTDDEILHSAVVSVIRVIVQTVLSILVTFSAAYGIIRNGLPYKRGITLFLMIPAYISAGTIPIYITYRYYGLINNFLVYVLPYIFTFYNMLIMRSFLQGIPESIAESGRIDGANEFTIMFKLIFPIAKPVIATVSLWVAVGAWNDWTTTLLYVTERELYPLQYVMMQLVKEAEVAAKMAQQAAMTGGEYVAKPTSDSITAATVMVTTIPIVMVYPFLQKYFISGVTLGAVKG